MVLPLHTEAWMKWALGFQEISWHLSQGYLLCLPCAEWSWLAHTQPYTKNFKLSSFSFKHVFCSLLWLASRSMVCPWLIELGCQSVRAPEEMHQVWPSVLAEALSILAEFNFCMTYGYIPWPPFWPVPITSSLEKDWIPFKWELGEEQLPIISLWTD